VPRNSSNLSSLIVTRQEIKAWNTTAGDILIPQKKEFLIRKVQSGLLPPKALRRYFISHASRCISTRPYASVHTHTHIYMDYSARRSEEKVPRRCPVDESGPNNRDLWRTRRVVSDPRLTGKRRFRRRDDIKLTGCIRVSCIPAALLFMPGALSGTKPSSRLRQSKTYP